MKGRKVHLLDHKLFELVDKVGGIEKIRSKDFKHITDNIGKQMYGDIEERVRPINLNLRNIADELNVPFIDKYALSCSDLKKSCEVLTPSGRKIFWDASHFTREGARYIGSKLLTEEFIAMLRF